MSVIHRTTMSPTKLELLTDWLPSQPWYIGGEGEPELSKAGGFRLDDPADEVGIEFMAITDEAGDRPVSYHLPLTYRGAPLEGADPALLGTAEHGVLGRRWVYDGTHDPVLVTQLLALLQGRATPQAQNVTDTADPTVVAHFAGGSVFASAEPKVVTDGGRATNVVVATGSGSATLTVSRVLTPDSQNPPAAAAKARGYVTAPWHRPDGSESRGAFVLLDADGR